MWVKGASAPGASGRRCSLPFRCCACRYVCRALVPRACPFRMAPALCPSAGPSAPARASPHACTPLKTRAKAAARVPLFMPGLFTPHVSTRLLRTSAFFRQMPQKKTPSSQTRRNIPYMPCGNGTARKGASLEPSARRQYGHSFLHRRRASLLLSADANSAADRRGRRRHSAPPRPVRRLFAMPAPPLKTHEGAAARVAIPRARLPRGGIVPRLPGRAGHVRNIHLFLPKKPLISTDCGHLNMLSHCQVSFLIREEKGRIYPLCNRAE